MNNLTPIAGRFTQAYEGYVHPAKLDAYESTIVGPEGLRPSWPGGSISGSDQCWDDCDE